MNLAYARISFGGGMYKTTVQRRCYAGQIKCIYTVSCTVAGKAVAYELQAAARFTFNTSFHLTSAKIYLVNRCGCSLCYLSFVSPNGYTSPLTRKTSRNKSYFS